MQVLVAAGGKPGFHGSFSSTEFLHLGASHWTYGPELPRPLDGASAALVNGKIILTGGFGIEGNEVSTKYEDCKVLCKPSHTQSIKQHGDSPISHSLDQSSLFLLLQIFELNSENLSWDLVCNWNDFAYYLSGEVS